MGENKPLPLTVMGVREEDARSTRSTVGEGAAKTDEAAARAATALKVFILSDVGRVTGKSVDMASRE